MSVRVEADFPQLRLPWAAAQGAACWHRTRPCAGPAVPSAGAPAGPRSGKGPVPRPPLRASTAAQPGRSRARPRHSAGPGWHRPAAEGWRGDPGPELTVLNKACPRRGDGGPKGLTRVPGVQGVSRRGPPGSVFRETLKTATAARAHARPKGQTEGLVSQSGRAPRASRAVLLAAVLGGAQLLREERSRDRTPGEAVARPPSGLPSDARPFPNAADGPPVGRPPGGAGFNAPRLGGWAQPPSTPSAPWQTWKPRCREILCVVCYYAAGGGGGSDPGRPLGT